MIAIVDFGLGNLRSVEKAFEFLGVSAAIVENPRQADKATHLVLPGDAAFGDAMSKLHKGGWVACIEQSIAAGKPFLGICVGLQLMFSKSLELGRHEGLGLLSGVCERFPSSERVPHIGWNQIDFNNSSPLLHGISSGTYFYFVHSYCVATAKCNEFLASTNYGFDFVSVVGSDGVFGVQFHPEKSQSFGLRLLENFSRIN
ncbi:MAG: imidazole glycerol phosphate synthase subunit HisH [Candidatus Latescibacterota bacterium]|nr:imidazole glycerol phosphate synthase subunit HisH [Candidatus Latescibacterota bacterium]